MNIRPYNFPGLHPRKTSPLKKLLFALALLVSGGALPAQTYTGISVGASRSDRATVSLRYQHQLTTRFSAGLQLSYGDINYRFINARPVQAGRVWMGGVSLGACVATGDRYRLDVNLTARYRNVQADDEALGEGGGLELDPQMVVALKLSETLFFYPGVMLRTSAQFSPATISDEQIPTGILLNGLGWQLGSKLLSLRTYTGPMFGAGGDTQKYNWQLAVGFQYFFSSKPASSIPVLNY